MTSVNLILITGRSTEQGIGLNMNKSSEKYRQATSMLELCEADLNKLGLAHGEEAKVKSEFGGETLVVCKAADLPEGMAFMAYGPATSLLAGSETHASGMPVFRNISIQLERIDGD